MNDNTDETFQCMNEKRAAIGKPPVREEPGNPGLHRHLGHVQLVVHHDRTFHEYLDDLAEIGAS